ncbi:MAG: dihydrodipicolinate synthase family protein [Phycisphaerales bacterium]|nr:dihydrodipicolinate synthase family protein [Phycisphaerales bacterium]
MTDETPASIDWSGVIPALTTPLRDDDTVDIAAAVDHAQWMIAQGCRGVVIGGSLGEGQSLTAEEKCELWKATSAALRGRAPVIAAIGAMGTREACALARRAAACGCSGLMILPPYAHSGDAREAIAHIDAVARETMLPAMVYNNPNAYRADLSAAEIAGLAANNPAIQAVKDSTGDASRLALLAKLIREGKAPPRLALFVGLDDVVLEGVAAGAHGWIAGLANALPAESVALFEGALAARGNPSRQVIELNRAFMPLLKMDTVGDFVQRIKLVQAVVGRGSEQVRPPRLPLAPADRVACLSIIHDSLAALGRIHTISSTTL